MKGLALLPALRGPAGLFLLTRCWISREAHPSPLLASHSTVTPFAFV